MANRAALDAAKKVANDGELIQLAAEADVLDAAVRYAEDREEANGENVTGQPTAGDCIDALLFEADWSSIDILYECWED